ncbi:hypothetical protein JOM56_008940 [Amanita muscaria]|uniref:1-acyl-sn-glycerol-3-phosphate acyltransferase n=1 Tax=Amanita muscaria (strain Koide BX008) TaxID=946122 RepID=A0A0C2X7X5_AMAMK|nr:hypothetical protein M378DRAFT_67365 [Amanita muscaria Koide BX008]
MSFLAALWRPLAYLSLPFILLRSIAASSPVGRYYSRVALYLYSLVSVATCSTALAGGMLLLGRRYDTNFAVARTFYAICRSMLNIEVEVEGEEYLSTRPAVYMMNHQSMLDILVVGRLMPKQTSIMAKRSIQYTPLGPFMTLSGAIFVERSNNVQAVQSLNVAGEHMKTIGTSLWMFPEGTRHSEEGPTLLPFKKGGFHLAIQAGIPIIPVVTENYWKMYRPGVFEEGRIRVRVLPPVSTIGLTVAEVSSLATRVRDQMLGVLRDISVQVPIEQMGREEVEADDALLESPQPKAVVSESKISATSQQIPIQEAGSASSLVMSPSTSSLGPWQSGASENGTETEEDEGMILVGRPA